MPKDDILEEQKPLPRDDEFTQIIRDGNLDAIKQYLESHDKDEILKKDEFGRNYLYDAAFTGNVEIVKTLIEFGFYPRYVDEYTGDTIVHIAAAEGYIDLLRYMLDEWHADVDPFNKEGKTPLFYALMFLANDESEALSNVHRTICRALIKRGARFQDNMREQLFENLKHLECQLIYDIHGLIPEGRETIVKKLVKFLIDDLNSYNGIL
ncbi:MAG: ankyrin repeat domain-containing protein [Alphaproteobacteria bacterium]|nr:ankyrin repeat domain-containing protein [Alphaproteobacteria bacterium]